MIQEQVIVMDKYFRLYDFYWFNKSTKAFHIHKNVLVYIYIYTNKHYFFTETIVSLFC